MRYRIPAQLAGLLLCASLASATVPLGYVLITAAHLTDFGGNALSNATITWSPVDAYGNPISARINGNGQGVTSPLSTQIIAGVFTLQVADTALTSPMNICYAVTVTDNLSGNTLLKAGYTCVQPAGSGVAVSGGSPWCTAAGGGSGGTCNFDLYPPNIPALAVTQTGPTGLTGPQGASTISGMSGDGTGNATLTGKFTAGTVAAGTTIQLGIASYAGLQTAMSACGSQQCAFFVNGNIAFPTNYTLPANVMLYFAGGQLQPAIATTLTVNGQIVAPVAQIFGGAGAIAGLGVTRPEWFGPATTVCGAINALAANGGDVFLQNANYRGGCEKNNPTDYNSMGWMTTPNVHIHGTARPIYNAVYTQLLNGTVILGGFYVRASGFHIEHVGFDSGSVVQAAYYTGYTGLDSLVVTGALPLDNTKYPYLTGVVIDDVNCLGQWNNSADHCMLVEDVEGAYVHNVQTVYHTHGLVLKGIASVLDGVYSRGHLSDGIIIKSSVYSPTNGNSLSHAQVTALITGGDTGGIAIYAETAPLLNLQMSDITVGNTSYGINLQADSSLTSVQISNYAFNGYFVVGSPCIESAFAGPIIGVTLTGFDCSNSTGITTTNPVQVLAIANGSIVGVTGTDAISLKSDASISNVIFGAIGGHGVNMLAGTASVSNLSGTTTGSLTFGAINPLTGNQVAATVATGTAPLLITSTTSVANLTLLRHPLAYLANSATPSTATKVLQGQTAATAGSLSVTFASAFTSSPACQATLTIGGSAVGVTTNPTVWVGSATATSVLFNTSSATFTGAIAWTCWGN
jgi:hypothetical protein